MSFVTNRNPLPGVAEQDYRDVDNSKTRMSILRFPVSFAVALICYGVPDGGLLNYNPLDSTAKSVLKWCSTKAVAPILIVAGVVEFVARGAFFVLNYSFSLITYPIRPISEFFKVTAMDLGSSSLGSLWTCVWGFIGLTKLY